MLRMRFYLARSQLNSGVRWLHTPRCTEMPTRTHHFLSRLQRLNLRDPLRANTRKERRLLLVLSFIAIAIGQSGLIPTKIGALGIEVERTDQRALLLLLTVVVAYSLVTFIIYAASDFVRLRGAYNSALLTHLQKEDGFYPAEDEPSDSPRARTWKRLERRVGLYMRLARTSAVIRTAWEFFFPVGVGLYAITVTLLTRAHLP